MDFTTIAAVEHLAQKFLTPYNPRPETEGQARARDR